MSATNKTPYYGLPQFIGTDIPSWLGDWNNTMGKLDSAINGVDTKAESSNATATTAENKADNNSALIVAQQAQIKALQDVVSDYAEILTFTAKPLAINPINCDVETRPDRNNGVLIQNSNKTISKITACFNIMPVENPVRYPFRPKIQVVGSTGFLFEAITLEDNCFNLTASSTPKEEYTLWLGWFPSMNTNNVQATNLLWPLYAWFDGVTTHICFHSVGNAINSYMVSVVTPIFLTGTIFDSGGAQ